MEADWSDLPQDLVGSLVKRPEVSLEGFIVLAGVCKSWRLATTRTCRLTHQVPFLMLPENEDKDDNICEFYNFTREKIYHLDLPEAKGRRCYSSLGWLFTIKLPDFYTFKGHAGKLYSAGIRLFDDIKKFVLSSSPVGASSYIVIALGETKLQFCRREDEFWSSLRSKEKIDDITYYKGQFYIVHIDGSVAACNFQDPNQPRRKILVPQMPSQLLPSFGTQKRLYLVETAGDLLVVSYTECDYKFSEPTPNLSFRVFKVPISNGEWRSDLEVKNLGNITLFLDDNSVFSVETSNDSGCKKNCIYFFLSAMTLGLKSRLVNSDKRDLFGKTVIGIFNMEDGKCELHFGPSFSSGKRKYSPNTVYSGYKWIQPNPYSKS
ncbi:hypothetical protein M0R45_010132 [Rubus argutus]|uniref:KIB1-4 beta-propeller domain-containing protein n=1 Tax=Rubus argutus TaxID=59490 RepID=A0AAW1Y741_RUBAR